MRRKIAMLLVGATVAALAMAGAAVAQTAASVIQCNRGPPKTCKGTPAKDTITSSGRADNIFALCSPDSVDGNGGDDLVKGGKGYDLRGKGGGLEGRPGDDKVMGQRGDDTVQVQVEHGGGATFCHPMRHVMQSTYPTSEESQEQRRPLTFGSRSRGNWVSSAATTRKIPRR
jgi:hypothetical protein